MIHQTISIKNVLARIVRNLDSNLPSHYLEYMLEWIPEAMEELETPFQLIKKSSPSFGCEGAIHTSNYVTSLPCGLVSLEAVEDRYGRRLRIGGDVTDVEMPTTRYHAGGNAYDNVRATNFQMDVDQVAGYDPNADNSTGAVPRDGTEITNSVNPDKEAYYKVQAGCIQTSEESMFVKLHYYAIPVDNEGYPLVPDHTEYKEALYWYVMGKLIGAGYKHPTIPSSLQGMSYCKQEYEFYAGRALGAIRTPSQDKMARLRDGFSQRLVPPHHFYDDFGINSEQIQEINK